MSKQPHVGFIITKAEVGGAQRWTLDQMRLLESDLTPHLICGESGWLTHAHHGEQIVLSALQKRIPTLTGLLQLKRYLLDHNIQTLVASSANAGIYARLIKIVLPKTRIVYVSHGWSSLYNGGRLAALYTFIERQLSRLTDLVLNVSKADEEKCISKIGVPTKKRLTILNRTPKPDDTKPNLDTRPLRLLFLGRLTHPKRPDLLISAVERFSSAQVQLSIVGDGPQRKQLENDAPENVHFVGEIQNFNHYHEHHLLCLISDSEGLPMSALEAKAAGLPLLMSNVGGCGELIDTEKKNGILCDNHVDEIYKAIEALLSSYPEYQANAQTVAKDAWLEPARYQYLAAYLPSANRDSL